MVQPSYNNFLESPDFTSGPAELRSCSSRMISTSDNPNIDCFCLVIRCVAKIELYASKNAPSCEMGIFGLYLEYRAPRTLSSVVERSLHMRKAAGSIPAASTNLAF